MARKATQGRHRKPVDPQARRSETFGKADAQGTAGRPPKFREEMIEQARHLVAEHDFTDGQIAHFFKITLPTLWRWKVAVPEFARAFLRGQEAQRKVLEASLFARATGYEFESEKLFPFKGRVVRAKTIEHVPPDPRAAQLLLQKLDPANYSPRMIHQGDPTQPVQFNMINRPPKKEAKHGGKK